MHRNRHCEALSRKIAAKNLKTQMSREYCKKICHYTSLSQLIFFLVVRDALYLYFSLYTRFIGIYISLMFIFEHTTIYLLL